MSLIKILNKNGITFSKEFNIAVHQTEKTFNKWSLILLCTIDDDLSFIMQAIKTIVDVDIKQAQAMALLARFKGQAVIANGEVKRICGYVDQFNKLGLTALAIDMFKK